MVREWIGPIEKLSDACKAQRMLWALCLFCGHAERLDPRHLLVLSGELTLRTLQDRLKCRRCGNRRARVLPHDEPWLGR